MDKNFENTILKRFNIEKIDQNFIDNLKELDLSNCNLKSIKGISKFINLTKIILTNNQIEDISEIKYCKKLILLNISNNKISNIDPLAEIKTLQHLYIEDNLIKKINNLSPFLKNIYLSNNFINKKDQKIFEKIENIPYGLDQQNDFKQKFEDKIIKFFDINIEKCIKNTLSIDDNKDILGKDILKLRKLDCSNCGIENIEGIEQAINLSSIDLSNNKVQNIDKLKKLNNLQKLDISNNQIDEIPENLGYNIEHLNLSNNEIKSWDSLKDLKKLKYLNISNCNVETLENFSKIESLKKLFVENNDLKNLNGIENFPNLKEIYLSYNKLETIENIEYCKKLEKIRFSYNLVFDLSPLIHFKKLKKLYCSYNRIDSLTPLKNIEITEKLSIGYNKISNFTPIEHLIDKKLSIWGVDYQDRKNKTPTSEQLKVKNYDFLNSDSNILKVNAFAGTGKTTTALMFAKNIKNYGKILYLTYNKSIQQDVKRKIDPHYRNIDVKTAHGLAYNILKLKKGKKILNITPIFINNLFYNQIERRDKKVEALKKSRVIMEFLNYYLNSSNGYKGEEILNCFKEYIPQNSSLIEFNSEIRGEIIINVINLLVYILERHVDRDYNFDFYLKITQFLVDPQLDYLKNRYQYIIFDEAQDASSVMYEIVKKIDCKKIFIGDTHQQIYSFRHAINSMEKIDSPELSLTYSFRFGKKIALLANNILALKGVKTDIKGTGIDDKIIPYSEKDSLEYSIPTKERVTIISRINAALFYYADSAIEEGRKIYFEGGIKSYIFSQIKAISIYYLMLKQYRKIEDKFVQKFESLYHIEEYSKAAKDIQLLNLIYLIKNYGIKFIDILNKIKQKAVENRDDCDLILTNTHKAKGMEYDNVLIPEDFKVDPEKIANNYENLNLLYVAITRTKKVLYLVESLLPILSIDRDKTVKKVLKYEKERERSKLKEIEDNNYGVYLGNRVKELDKFWELLSQNYRSIRGKVNEKIGVLNGDTLRIIKNMVNLRLDSNTISKSLNIDEKIIKAFMKNI